LLFLLFWSGCLGPSRALRLKRDTITTTPPFAPSVPTTITFNTTTPIPQSHQSLFRADISTSTSYQSLSRHSRQSLPWPPLRASPSARLARHASKYSRARKTGKMVNSFNPRAMTFTKRVCDSCLAKLHVAAGSEVSSHAIDG
jgi:hypothetical protein